MRRTDLLFFQTHLAIVRIAYLAPALLLLFSAQVSAQSTPELLTQDETGWAVALDSVTRIRDPFSVETALNFSMDGRTRVMLFARNVDSDVGTGTVTALAEDAQLNKYFPDVEFVAKVPGFDWLTQVVIRLPNQLENVGDVWVSITVSGAVSNKVRVHLVQTSSPTPTPTPTPTPSPTPSPTPPSSLPPMTFPGANWQQATPETLGIDSTKLEAAFSYLSQHVDISTSAVVRNGYLIRTSGGIDSRFGTFSVTKSFTSTVLGLLIDDGKASLNTLAKDHVAVMATLYPTVNLSHFATMTSGYDALGAEYDVFDGSTNPFVPTTPLFTPPGSKYAYLDDAMNQFGNVLTQIADEPIYDLFKRRVADPIGMTSWSWPSFWNLDGHLVYEGSGNQTGINISARQLARLGHLFLNRGNWNGSQLISSSWIDQATANQVPASIAHSGVRPSIDGRGVYGFNWWVNGIKPNGARKWTAAPLKTFSAWGINENRIWVIPEWNMVIVRVGGSGDVSDTVWNNFFERLREAILIE